MNHIKAILLAATVLLMGTASAQQHRGAMMHGRGAGEGRMLGLDLTDDQRAKIEDLRVKHLKDIEPLRADLQKQQSALALEITAEKFNEAKVKTVQGEISKIQTAIASNGIAHQRAIRDLLTPAQRTKFDARILEGGRGPGIGGLGRREGRGPGSDRCGSCPGCRD